MKYIKKVNHNDEGCKLLNEALADIKNGVWIGEYGDAVCSANNETQALKIFIKLMTDDVGEEESKEVKMSNVGIGWLQLWQEGEYKGDCEATWYVSYTVESEYQVFVYQP